MRFYEYEARQLLEKRGIPVAKGGTAKSAAEAQKIAAELEGPVTVKPQAITPMPMPGGGAKRAEDAAGAKRLAEELLGTEINGKKPACVLVEAAPKAVRTFSLACTYDGTAKLPVMYAADVAGYIEDLKDSHPDRVKHRHFSTLYPLSGYQAKELAMRLGLSGSALTRVTGVLTRLGRLFLDYDLTQADIGALAELENGSFVALQTHMDMEIEGRARQGAILKELGVDPSDTRAAREPTPFEVEAAKIDEEDPRGVAGPVVEFDGNIGLVIGAGGGSLTTFDAVKKHGGRPANYAAIGGNPSVKKAQRLTQLVLSKPGVEKIAVISNVVSNTRADLVARGVIKGVVEMGKDPAETITIFRAPGAWEADAVKILSKYGVEFCDRTVSISEAAKRAVAKIAN